VYKMLCRIGRNKNGSDHKFKKEVGFPENATFMLTTHCLNNAYNSNVEIAACGLPFFIQPISFDGISEGYIVCNTKYGMV
jgi:hypothetical protein